MRRDSSLLFVYRKFCRCPVTQELLRPLVGVYFPIVLDAVTGCDVICPVIDPDLLALETLMVSLHHADALRVMVRPRMCRKATSICFTR